MKKIMITLICLLLCISMNAQQIEAKDSGTNILIHIEEADDMYLLNIKGDKMKVQMISNKLYLPISCLDNEKTTLKSVNFKSSYDCMVTSLNNALSINIKYYANVKMKKLLKRLDINKNTYDYKTLDSLCDTGKKIKNNIHMGVLLDYQKYIDTNIDFETIYELYNFFMQDKIKITYYALSYFVIDKKYIPMSTSFQLKKKTQ